MQYTTPSVRSVAWAILVMVLATTSGAAIATTSSLDASPAVHPETDCGDDTPPLSAGNDRAGSLDPAVDTEDAVALAAAAGWQQRGVAITVEVGKESAATSYTLRVETFANTDCSGAALTSHAVAYGETVTVSFTPTTSATHGIRFSVEEYAGATVVDETADKGRVEGHCFPHCAMDWWIQFALGHSP